MLERPRGGAGRIHVVAAACSGSVALSCALETPIVCIRAVRDPRAELLALNGARHGGSCLRAGGPPPFEARGGWDDWKILCFEGEGVDALPPGVDVVDGCIALHLPVDVHAARFQEALYRSMRGFRLDAALPLPPWLLGHDGAGGSLLALPRFTMVPRPDAPPRAVFAGDLFALDPAEHLAQVARLACEAVGLPTLAQGHRR